MLDCRKDTLKKNLLTILSRRHLFEIPPKMMSFSQLSAAKNIFFGEHIKQILAILISLRLSSLFADYF